MGNFESKGTEFIDQFSNNYRYERSVNDSRLGDIKIYSKIFDEQDLVAIKIYPYLQKVNQMNTFTTFMNQNGNLIGTNQNDHPNLIKLHAYSLNPEQGLTLYYEYCYTNVKEQIDMRITHGIFFSAEELWRTILSVVMAGNFLEQQNRHIGDVNTKRMFINKKGVVKMAPYMQAQSDIDSFKRAGFFNEYGFLSPECLERFKERDVLASVNYMKNDVYGLGISILEMATLKHSQEIYDWDKYQIKQNILQDRLEESRQRYGEYLELFIRRLLHNDINKRYSFSQLFQELLPYQQQIITGQGFSDIQIFKVPNNGASGFDSIIRKLDANNNSQQQQQQQSQEALTTTYNQTQISKASNQPSLYQSSEQNKPNTISLSNLNNYSQSTTTTPIAVQIKLSPVKNNNAQIIQQHTQISSQSIPNQQNIIYSQYSSNQNNNNNNNNILQNHIGIQQGQVQLQQPQLWDINQDKSKIKTEESDRNSVNSYLQQHNSNNSFIYTKQQYGQPTIYTSSNNNNNQIQTTNKNINSTSSMLIHGNTIRENPMTQRVQNSHRPLNQDQRSLSPSPVLHLKVNNKLTIPSHIQNTPISVKQGYNNVHIYGNQTDRSGLNQINQNNNNNPIINLNDYKKTPIPIKKITLNSLLNQNVSTQNNNNIINNQKVHQNKIIVSNQIQGIPTQISNVVNQDNYTSRNEDTMVKLNMPIQRGNRNMVLGNISHNNRSVSPSHVLIQRSITPNVRTQFQNQVMLVSPSSNNQVITQFNHIKSQNDNFKKTKSQYLNLDLNNNIVLPNRQYTIQSNQVINNNNNHSQGFCFTDRNIPSITTNNNNNNNDYKPQQQYVAQNSSTGFYSNSPTLEFLRLSPKNKHH